MRSLSLATLLVGVVANEYQTHSKVPVVVNTIGPFNNPAETYKVRERAISIMQVHYV